MIFEGISQIAFRVSDIERSLAFYTGTLGLKHLFNFYREDGTPWMYYLRVSKYQYIELIPAGTVEKTADQSLHHICLIVKDVKSAAAGLMEKGVRLYRGPAEMGREIKSPGEIAPGLCNSPSFYIEDPDHNAIEIMQFLPESKQLAYETD
jgi:lactoylglutathione lyase